MKKFLGGLQAFAGRQRCSPAGLRAAPAVTHRLQLRGPPVRRARRRGGGAVPWRGGVPRQCRPACAPSHSSLGILIAIAETVRLPVHASSGHCTSRLNHCARSDSRWRWSHATTHSSWPGCVLALRVFGLAANTGIRHRACGLEPTSPKLTQRCAATSGLQGAGGRAAVHAGLRAKARDVHRSRRGAPAAGAPRERQRRLAGRGRHRQRRQHAALGVQVGRQHLVRHARFAALPQGRFPSVAATTGDTGNGHSAAHACSTCQHSTSWHER